MDLDSKDIIDFKDSDSNDFESKDLVPGVTVHYSLLLHLVTRAMVDDVELLETVVDELGVAMRSRPGWWSHLTLFEHAKMLTVELTMRKYVSARRAATIPDNFGHLGGLLGGAACSYLFGPRLRYARAGGVKILVDEPLVQIR